MSEPFLSQISAFAFGVVPMGWAACNGQLLPVQQNQALFSLLGTTFGGDGQTTFGLPNLQGRVPLGAGPGFSRGDLGGEASHILTQNEMPQHTHPVVASSLSTDLQSQPGGNFPAAPTGGVYATSASTTLGGGSSPSGGSQPHENMQPCLAMQYCIAIQGLFPPRS